MTVPGTTATLTIDGTAAFSAQAFDVGATTLTTASIAARRSNATDTTFGGIDAGNLCLFNRALTTAETNQLLRYFGRKYGLTIS